MTRRLVQARDESYAAVRAAPAVDRSARIRHDKKKTGVTPLGAGGRATPDQPLVSSDFAPPSQRGSSLATRASERYAYGMGTDVNGWVEFRHTPDSEHWLGAIDVGTVLARDYDLFGLLFGVRNYANFDPVFPDRGIPEGSCIELPEGTTNATWAGFVELRDIDPNVSALAPDDRIHEYRVLPDGTEVLDTKAEWSARVEPHREEIMRVGQRSGLR